MVRNAFYSALVPWAICQYLGVKYYVPGIGFALALRDKAMRFGNRAERDGSPFNRGPKGEASPLRKTMFLAWHVVTGTTLLILLRLSLGS